MKTRLKYVIEDKDRHLPVQNQERFGLGRLQMAMRSNIGAPHHHIQEAMRIVLHGRMEVVIDAKSRRAARPRDKLVEQRLI